MTYPNYLGEGIPYKPLVDSWAIADPYLDPLETDMDGGNKRLRTRPGDNLTRLQFSVLMSSADFVIFKSFVRDVLNNGTSRFNMPVWDGNSHVTKLVQFASKYKPNSIPPKYTVQFDLWVYGGL